MIIHAFVLANVLFVNFLEPHYPYNGPCDGQYDPDDRPLPENFESVPGAAAHLKNRYLKEHWYHCGHGGEVFQKPADWRAVMARYWGNCSLVDTHAGRILATLEELGLRDNTIVVYTSDHGDMMSRPTTGSIVGVPAGAAMSFSTWTMIRTRRKTWPWIPAIGPLPRITGAHTGVAEGISCRRREGARREPSHRKIPSV